MSIGALIVIDVHAKAAFGFNCFRSPSVTLQDTVEKMAKDNIARCSDFRAMKREREREARKWQWEGNEKDEKENRAQHWCYMVPLHGAMCSVSKSLALEEPSAVQTDVFSFEWISQLRYYWEVDPWRWLFHCHYTILYILVYQNVIRCYKLYWVMM